MATHVALPHRQREQVATNRRSLEIESDVVQSHGTMIELIAEGEVLQSTRPGDIVQTWIEIIVESEVLQSTRRGDIV